MNIKDHCTKLVQSKLDVITAQERLAKETKQFLEDAVMDGHFELLQINMNAVLRNAEQKVAWELRDKQPHRPKPLPPREYTQDEAQEAFFTKPALKKY